MFEGQFTADNWHRDARSLAERNRIRSRRWGMRVTVYLTADAGDYVLSYGLSSTNLQDNANWLKVADIGDTWGGGGGGGITTADNGLNLSTATNVQWGGPLIVDTYIEFLDGNSYFNLNPGDGGDPYFDLYMEDALHFSEFFQARDVQLLLVDGVSIQLDPTLIDIAANPGNVAISGEQVDITSLTTDVNIVAVGSLLGQGDFVDLIANQIAGITANELAFTSQGGNINFTAFADMNFVGGANINISSVGDISLRALANAVGLDLNGGIAMFDANGNLIDLGAGITLDSATVLTIDIGGDVGAAGQALMSDGAGKVVWDTPGGGSTTADNGLTETAGNIQLGGPLTQNTLINGAGFDLQIGTFVSSPLDSFQSYAASHFWSSRDSGTGAAAGLTLNTEFQVGFASDGGKMIVQQTTAQTSVTNPLTIMTRLGNNTNTPGLMHADSVNSSGTAAAGFGVYHQTDIEVSNGTSWVAMQDEITWEVATVGGEYSQWRKLLTQNHSVIEVYKIETNTQLLHTISGHVLMPNLPTSSAGLAAGTLWNNSGVLNVA